jgi:hypothetical protein
MTTIKFKATGLVYGNYWGGGSGSYPSVKLEGNTKEELLELAKTKLASGALDGGMGYERLIGAMLNIKQITTKVIDGKDFVNEETETEFIGDLTEDNMNFLEYGNDY